MKRVTWIDVGQDHFVAMNLRPKFSGFRHTFAVAVSESLFLLTFPVCSTASSAGVSSTLHSSSDCCSWRTLFRGRQRLRRCSGHSRRIGAVARHTTSPAAHASQQVISCMQLPKNGERLQQHSEQRLLHARRGSHVLAADCGAAAGTADALAQCHDTEHLLQPTHRNKL